MARKGLPQVEGSTVLDAEGAEITEGCTVIFYFADAAVRRGRVQRTSQSVWEVKNKKTSGFVYVLFNGGLGQRTYRRRADQVIVVPDTEWRHCSPELLAAGVDCANTPRRPCLCLEEGSHDHKVPWPMALETR